MRSSASRPCSGGGPAGRRAGGPPGVRGGAVLRARPVPRTRLDGCVAGRDGRGSAAGGRAGSGAARRARSQRPGRRAARLRSRGGRGARGGRIGRRRAGARRARHAGARVGRVDLRRPGAPRAGAGSRRGAAHRERGGGGRHLREPGRPGAALRAGEAGTGHGAARLVGVLRAGRGLGPRRVRRQCRRGVRARRAGNRGVPRPVLRAARVRRQARGRRGPRMSFFLVASIIKIVVVFTVIMVGVALLTLAERRICAWMQDRLGPNRVGPQGLLQPAADGLKNLVKEETLPAQADKALFMLAPAMSFIPALLAFAVIPFAAPLPTPWGDVDMVVANLPVGFLYILAFGSLGVYGIVLAGWSSNNKYSLLGGLRASAQMISYEIALGMSTVAVLLLVGNVTLTDVIAKQSQSLFTWNVFLLFLAFFIFIVAAFAETNRLPFDLPEAEGELIAGYHTEYSAMKFSMFYIAEYSNMVTASALMTTLFFGGWDIPFTTWDNTPPWTTLKTLATLAMFSAKVMFFLFLYIWVRWTLPRFRYDQLMALGWKVMLPLALAYVTVIATAIWLLHDGLGWMYDTRFALALFALNLVLAVPLFFVLDRGHIVAGSVAEA